MFASPSKSNVSKAATTRLSILQKAFDLIYQRGFQATSIDDILATTQVTKGAFFYHFKNKEEMGLALINEVMYPGMKAAFSGLTDSSSHPVEAIHRMVQHALLHDPFFRVEYGCPAVNLIEEMAPLNDSFHQALSRLVNQWQQAIQACVSQGIASGKIRQEVSPGQVANFVIAGYSGIRNMGKLLGPACYHDHLKELKNYLDKLT
jgi:TetR/AcrR family transcriptional regulator, transcriptional repressor for nem operon